MSLKTVEQNFSKYLAAQKDYFRDYLMDTEDGSPKFYIP